MNGDHVLFLPWCQETTGKKCEGGSCLGVWSSRWSFGHTEFKIPVRYSSRGVELEIYT